MKLAQMFAVCFVPTSELNQLECIQNMAVYNLESFRLQGLQKFLQRSPMRRLTLVLLAAWEDSRNVYVMMLKQIWERSGRNLEL